MWLFQVIYQQPPSLPLCLIQWALIHSLTHTHTHTHTHTRTRTYTLSLMHAHTNSRTHISTRPIRCSRAFMHNSFVVNIPPPFFLQFTFYICINQHFPLSLTLPLSLTHSPNPSLTQFTFLSQYISLSLFTHFPAISYLNGGSPPIGS